MSQKNNDWVKNRGDWKKELLLGAIGGQIYGGTTILVGHPFDTIKTKMQAQSEHMGTKIGPIQTFKNVMVKEGPIGLFRGFWPPFMGAAFYRGAQFAVFEAFYTMWEKNAWLA